MLYRVIRQRDDYIHMPGTIFHVWLEGAMAYEEWRKIGFSGGYKLHVSAHEPEAEEVAGLVLPVLRDMSLNHKIVSSPEKYERMNAGPQGGKFITIYAGPLMETFTKLVGVLDPLLQKHHCRPGPRPMERQKGGTTPEKLIGKCGLLTYFSIEDFTH